MPSPIRAVVVRGDAIACGPTADGVAAVRSEMQALMTALRASQQAANRVYIAANRIPLGRVKTPGAQGVSELLGEAARIANAVAQMVGEAHEKVGGSA